MKEQLSMLSSFHETYLAVFSFIRIGVNNLWMNR